MSLVRRLRWATVGVVLVLSFVGCTKKTYSDDDDNGGGGGSGGSSALGGTGGTLGGGAKGGTSGTSGSGGGGTTPSTRCPLMCTKLENAACTDFNFTNCSQTCAMIAGMARDTTTCTVEWNALFDCVDALSNVCALTGTSPACSTQNVDAVVCLEDYCSDHPTTSYCM